MKPRALGAVIVCGALVLVGIVWIRTPPSNKPGFVPPAPQHPEFGAAGQAYDLSMSAVGHAAFEGAIRDAVRSAAVRSSTGVGPDDLASIAAEHLTLLVRGEFTPWLEFASRFAPDVRGASESSTGEDSFEARWNVQAKPLAGSRVSTSGVRMVKIVGDPEAFPEDRSEPGTMITSSRPSPGSKSVNPAYRTPRGPRVECYEIQVPVEVAPLEGGRVRAMAGLRYARENPDAPWQPVDLFLYFDSAGFGKQFVDPAF